MSLTPNAVEVLAKQGKADDDFKPVLQAVDVRGVGQGDKMRCRVVLSDGKNFIQSVLSNQLQRSSEVTNNLTNNSILRLLEFVTNEVSGTMVVIVIRFEILYNPGMKYGIPVAIGCVGNELGMNRAECSRTPASSRKGRDSTTENECSGGETQSIAGMQSGGGAEGGRTYVTPTPRKLANSRGVNRYSNEQK